MDRAILIVYHSTGCPLLKMIDDGRGGRLFCPRGSFTKYDIKSHTGGWFLKPCDDCTISRPLSDFEIE